MSKKLVVAHHQVETRSVKSYLLGFVMSLALSLAAFFMVAAKVSHGGALLAAVTVLAILQLLTQLTFFLHVGQEQKPRWNMQVLLFALMVVVIIVFGSLWIMKNLDYNHRQPVNETNQGIIKDEGYQQ